MRRKHQPPHFFSALLVLASSFAPATLWAQAETAEAAKSGPKGEADKTRPQFVRVVRDKDDHPQELQTAIVSYTGMKNGVALTVDLVGAIHIGDKKYYDDLNKRFADYESVLYELVAPEGTVVPKGGRKQGGGHPIAMLQGGMKSLLELEHQLECIDYTKANFVHADMSPEEFAKSMKDRGEGFVQMFFRMMGQGIANQSKDANRSSDTQLLFALFAKDRAHRLKQIMAGQFGDVSGAMSALSGPDGSAIITERNKKALEVLTLEIEAGKRKVAIFYGAGHLADMEKRLQQDFHLQRSKLRWLTAWDLRQNAGSGK